MFERVDPFIGTEATSLPPQHGLAKTWWWPKPQVGNTHPGATYPLGMVSACAYSGAYPTGYGRYDLGTEGLPTELYDRQVASGFTHFQQSGTGAIRKYYNYFRVTPMLQPLDDLGQLWDVVDESAEPGYYTATLEIGHPRGDHGRPEERRPPVHVPGAPGRAAGHRLLARRPVDPARPDGAAAGAPALDQPGDRAGRDRRRGCSAGDPRGVRRPALAAAALVRPSAHAGRHAAGLRPDPADDAAAVRADVGGAVGTRSGGGAAVRVLAAGRRPGAGEPRAGVRAGSVQLCDDGARRPRTVWQEALGKIRVDTPSKDKQTVFSTALYHSLIKPCLAPDESPFWPADGPFAFDIATMWDIYRTQLPLLTTLMPDKAVELANALLYISEEEGNLPIGYRMARGADQFSRQASRAGAHVPGRPVPARAAGHGLGLGAGAHAQRPAPDVRRGLPAARQGAPDQPHAGPGVRVLVHVADRGARRRPGARRAVHAAGRAVGQRVRRGDRPPAGLHLLRGRALELLVPAAARHGGAHQALGWRRRVRRAARPVLRVRRARPSRSRGSGRPSRRWPRGTR